MTENTTNKRALIGAHAENDRNAGVLSRYLKSFGYSTEIKLKEEFLSYIDRKEHSVYIQEANQGEPGSKDISPAFEAYSKLEQRIQSEGVKYIAISGDENILKPLREKGIAVLVKEELGLSTLAALLGMKIC